MAGQPCPRALRACGRAAGPALVAWPAPRLPLALPDLMGRILAIDGRLARSPYPEREEKTWRAPDAWARALLHRAQSALATPIKRELQALSATMAAQAEALAAASDDTLRTRLRQAAPAAVH